LILLDQPSFLSLIVQAKLGNNCLSSATGFIVNRPDGSSILITNWHVVSGRYPDRDETISLSGKVPDSLSIRHNADGELGSWTDKTEKLYDDSGKPLWLEHPFLGSRVDVVGLPLTNLEGIARYPYSYSGPVGHDVANFPASIKWGPSDFVNVVGFPFGLSSGGGHGIWVQGAIATEPELDYEELPKYLIDSRTRTGQSGSPVVIYKRNGWITLSDGRPFLIHNPIMLLIGVYSGRVNKESDLGTVWKTQVVEEIAISGRLGAPPEIAVTRF
jgi:hypothetical protein